jgi:hypothetical protein
LPPVKSHLARPVQRAAAGGSPAGSSGAKSKDWEATQRRTGRDAQSIAGGAAHTCS